jgi:hypothetical protein
MHLGKDDGRGASPAEHGVRASLDLLEVVLRQDDAVPHGVAANGNGDLEGLALLVVATVAGLDEVAQVADVPDTVIAAV